ncbi:MAG: sugar ABC transporter permease [Chloroflexota bacterium]
MNFLPPQSLWKKSASSKQHATGAKQRSTRWGLLFLSPWLVGFVLFIALPLFTSLSYSFMEFDLLHPDEARFIGLGNYQRLLADPIARRSIVLTAVYVLIWTPISILIPLGFATLLHSRHLFSTRLFRLGFYLPTLVPELAVVFIIGSFFSPFGWFNRLLLGPLGFEFDGFALNTLIGLIIFSTSLWGVGNIILILLAAKQGIPVELYEAADVDGASPWRKYWNITLPFMSPIIFYSLIISLITASQIFAAPFLLGGNRWTFDEDAPAMFLTLYIFRQIDIYRDLGYAATLGWALAGLTALAAGLLFFSTRFWVYYGDE